MSSPMFGFLREAEAKRLEEASAKLRNQRLVAEERKKEREVKITDRLPPPKRQRTGWASNPAPKTLFQKTRSDASKLQRNLYTRIVPPMPPKGKRAAILPKPSISNLEFLPTTTGTSRVTVTNVVRRRPGISPSTSSTASTSTLASPSNLVQATSSGSSSLVTNLPPPVAKPHCLTAPSQSATGATQSPTKPPFRADVSAPPQPRPLKPPSQKKDPMASLFVPKRRAYSQLP
ncbi:hypothetical protein H0H87_005143 [Tephrocybe sp. NHM501043]|nr:hypothetical protein H0H87_005143 [Tephrocybe sp. NHM501043]